MKKIKEVITTYLDAASDDNDRLEKIHDLLHLLNFEKRLAELSEDEKKSMWAASQSKLTPEMKCRLDKCKTSDQRDTIIEEYARNQYFRQCAWIDYLNGHSAKP